MESIFNQQSQEQSQEGSDFWKVTGNKTSTHQIAGIFYQQKQDKIERYRQFYLNQRYIFWKQHSINHCFDLVFSLLEEKLYLKNQKRVYGIKLSKNNQNTQLFTYNQQLFIKFYTFLSKICILTNFQEHYKVKNSIGSGSFSVVYHGENIFSRRIVALKAYNKQQMKKKTDGIQLVKNQILNLHSLKKHNISPLIQTYETYDCIILVQHKAQAGDMMKYITKQANNFNDDLIRMIIKQILEKVKLLHSLGYIHRDLKPQNILFLNNTPRSTLYLSDLGLTVRKSDLKNKNIKHFSCGTLGFIAPQVLNYVQGSEYDELCDIFSVGCIFYFLYTGIPLFQGRNQKERYLKNKKCQNIAQRLDQLEDQINSDALDLMKILLKVNPIERISASDACNHKYFKNNKEKFEVIFQDTTTQIKDFLVEKIQKYWKGYNHQIC